MKCCEENQTQWSELLQGFLMAYRSAVHQSVANHLLDLFLNRK